MSACLQSAPLLHKQTGLAASAVTLMILWGPFSGDLALDMPIDDVHCCLALHHTEGSPVELKMQSLTAKCHLRMPALGCTTYTSPSTAERDDGVHQAASAGRTLRPGSTT